MKIEDTDRVTALILDGTGGGACYSIEDFAGVPDDVMLAAVDYIELINREACSSYVKIVPYAHLNPGDSDAVGVIHEEVDEFYIERCFDGRDVKREKILRDIERVRGVMFERVNSWSTGVFIN